MENIYLVGFMGTGKSTVAKEMAKLLPINIVDMDGAIETLAGTTISDIFEKQGEEAFRNMETMFLNAISKEKNQIISCGGGAVLRRENVDIMKNTGIVCLLTGSAELICERVNGSNDRPLLQNKKTVEDIKKLMDSRKEAYDYAADLTYSIDNTTSKQIAAEIVKDLALKGFFID